MFRPAVAIALLWAGCAWAQGEQQTYDTIRPQLPEQYEANPNAVTTLQSTMMGQAVEPAEEPGPAQGISASLTAGIGYDDNVFRTERDTKDDSFWVVQPRVYLNGLAGKHSYVLGYEGDWATYTEYSSEDFDDHRIFGDATLDVSRKVDVQLGAQYWWGHDPRGSLGNRILVPGDLDTWQEYGLEGSVVIGREITRAQIVPSVELSGRRYTNNNQSIRDYDRQDYRLRGRYRFTDRLYGLAEGGYAVINHLDASNLLDRTETDILAGVGWQATAKTSGEAMFGILNRDFEDDPFKGSTTSPTWNIRIHWMPKPYSKVTLFTQRSSEENAGGVGSFLADTYGVLWRHAFSERLELDTGFDFTVAEYDSPREDKYYGFDIRLTYGLTRWLDVSGVYRYLGRQSNIPGLDYDDNAVLLELTAGFEHNLGL